MVRRRFLVGMIGLLGLTSVGAAPTPQQIVRCHACSISSVIRRGSSAPALRDGGFRHPAYAGRVSVFSWQNILFPPDTLFLTDDSRQK